MSLSGANWSPLCDKSVNAVNSPLHKPSSKPTPSSPLVQKVHQYSSASQLATVQQATNHPLNNNPFQIYSKPHSKSPSDHLALKNNSPSTQLASTHKLNQSSVVIIIIHDTITFLVVICLVQNELAEQMTNQLRQEHEQVVARHKQQMVAAELQWQGEVDKAVEMERIRWQVLINNHGGGIVLMVCVQQIIEAVSEDHAAKMIAREEQICTQK